MFGLTIPMAIMVIAAAGFMLTKSGLFFGGVTGLELISTLIFVGGVGLVIASKDPLIISLLLLLLFKRVSYKPPFDSEYDYETVRFDLITQ